MKPTDDDIRFGDFCSFDLREEISRNVAEWRAANSTSEWAGTTECKICGKKKADQRRQGRFIGGRCDRCRKYFHRNKHDRPHELGAADMRRNE